MNIHIQRKIGIALITVGLILLTSLTAVFLWILTREMSQHGNLAFFWQKDFYYVLPVFLFLLPGIYFTSIGRKMLRKHNIGTLSYIEIVLMFIIGIAVLYFNLNADEDYIDHVKPQNLIHNHSPSYEIRWQ